jgi:outer membrane protein assembly factor BamB
MSLLNRSSQNGSQNGRPRRLSILFWLAIAVFVSVPLARAYLFETDHQYANMIGTLLTMLGCLLAYLAIWRTIARSGKSHALFAALPLILGVCFASTFKWVRFSGEMVPQFAFRWTKQPSARPSQVGPESNSLKSVYSPNPKLAGFRSTQFLGNDRNGVVSNEEFSVRWNEKLPTIQWKQPIGGGWSGFAVSDGLAITQQQVDARECVTAFELNTGKTVWQAGFEGKHYHPLGGVGPRATLAIQDSNVYIQTATGIVACLELISGDVIWKQDLHQLAGTTREMADKSIFWGRSGSPLICDDMLVVPFGGKKGDPSLRSLIAFDRSTGKQRWQAGEAQVAYSSPMLLTLGGVPQIVSVNEGNATGHDPSTGAVLWTTPWPSLSNGDACASQPVAIDGEHFLLGKGYAAGSKLVKVTNQKNDGSQLWTAEDTWVNTRVLKTKFTSAILHEGSLFALSDGVLECVEPMTGKRIWRGKRYGQGQLIIVNDHLLVSAEDGRVVLVPAISKSNNGTAPEELGQVQAIEGITWNVPTVAGPYLLVRNSDEVACLVSRKGSSTDELVNQQ